MTPEQLAEDFLKNTEKVAAWNKAASSLRECGFEEVIRRLGEVKEINLNDSRHMELAAIDQIEKRGWQAALDLVFDFLDVMDSSGSSSEDTGDYGATEALKKMGYTEGELE